MPDYDEISHMVIEKIEDVTVQVFDIVSQDVHIIDQHNITGTSILCPQHIVPEASQKCDICFSTISTKTIKKLQIII